MKQTRREFLRTGSQAAVAVGLGACAGDAEQDSGSSIDLAPVRDPEPEAWSAPGSLDDQAFPMGVQIGDAMPSRVRISLHATVGRVRFVLMRAEGSAWVEDRSLDNLEVEEGPLQLDVDDLAPDTAYSLVFYAEDGQSRTRVARFRTAISSDCNRTVVFGATSCLRGNLPWPCLSRAAEEALDFFVLLGDSVYASASTLAGYRADWADVLEVEGMVALTTSTSIVATWDDHEVANNWSMEVVGKDRYMAALQAFREALPQTEGPGGGIWRSLRWGSTVEVFVLDCRTEREGDAYISVEQMNWLKQGLLDSPSRFKIICNSVPITDLTAIFGQAQEDDRWQGYPGQREEILSHIESLDIEGVLWITGDVHYGQIARVSASGEIGDEAYEIFCGPGGSTVNIGALYYVGEDEQYEQLVLDFNYARFECDPVAGTIRVQHIDNEGYTLTDRVLNL